MNRLFLAIVVLLLPGGITYADYPLTTLPSIEARDLYIDLLKKCVANTIYCDGDQLSGEITPYDQNKRIFGLDWPEKAHTMIGLKRLDNIDYCLREILANNIPGDCIETGVWRGGATILMRGILKAFQDKNRKVWVVDSFAGLPPPNPEKYPHDAGYFFNISTALVVSIEEVQGNFAKYGLLDDQVIFLKGIFSETLPHAPIGQLSLLRLDGDLYESTMDALVNLYDKVSVGGFVIIDDYGIPCCAHAVHDFRAEKNIQDPIIMIDGAGVYWRKSNY
ncbi:MAG: TylF/MycF family methyltransferase [Rhabdochlamydiaceae bacterium]